MIEITKVYIYITLIKYELTPVYHTLGAMSIRMLYWWRPERTWYMYVRHESHLSVYASQNDSFITYVLRRIKIGKLTIQANGHWWELISVPAGYNYLSSKTLTEDVILILTGLPFCLGFCVGKSHASHYTHNNTCLEMVLIDDQY